MEFEQNRKVLVARGDYSSLQRILKQTFEIDGEIKTRNLRLTGRILWINEKVLSKSCKHIFFSSDGLKFSVWWVTVNSKPFPKVGNFELKSYPKG